MFNTDKLNLYIPAILFILSHIIILSVYIISILTTSALIYNYYKFYNIINIDFLLLTIIISCLSFGAMLTVNNYYYPNSIFAIFSINKNYIFNLFFIFYFLAYSWLIINLLSIFIYFYKYQYFYFTKISLIILLFAISQDNNIFNYKNYNIKQPNIILLSIDSLRFDYLQKMPALNNIIKNAVNFTNAYTPLGRSYPALHSLLSGMHPKNSGIRFNLIDLNNNQSNKFLLPNILKTQGYQSIYFSDSNQFHLVNKSWGYDHIVTPTQGIYEHILPNINDLPWSNLISSWPISRYLFPYSFANPIAHYVYTPNVYTELILTSIQKLFLSSKPALIHINFEAAHWPYMHADFNNQHYTANTRYTKCLIKLDQQIKNILLYFKKFNLLENTILFIISDHGEAFSLYNDRDTQKELFIANKKLLKLYPKQPLFKPHNGSYLSYATSGGHGTDVLSSSQYRIVMAAKNFHTDLLPNKNININSPVTLMDIYPTITQWLNIQHPKTDGLSLDPLIKQQPHAKLIFKKRPIYLETGLMFPYLQADDLKNNNIINIIIQKWLDTYYINAKNLMLLQPQVVNKLLKTKQHAVLLDNYLLTHLPANANLFWSIKNISQKNNLKLKSHCDFWSYLDKTKKHIFCGKYQYLPQRFILLNKTTGQWSIKKNLYNHPNNKIYKNHYKLLKNFYNHEILY